MHRLVCAAALLACTPGAQAQEEFNWRGTVAVGRTVEIRGVNGAIHAEPHTGSQVEVVALKRGRRNDPAEVDIQVVPHDGGVTICAVYPSTRRGQPNECRPGGGRSNTGNNDVEVRFTVRLPAGVHLEGHTVNGSVRGEGLAADVRAGTVNGSVNIATTGRVSATTVNGSITATMARADWVGEARLSTTNGSVTVMLPADLSAEINASTTNGRIETDFPVTVEGRVGARNLRGTVGEGGRTLTLRTTNGSIRLRQT